MNDEERAAKLKWRIEMEEKYVVLCKFCYRKTFDPDKTSNQLFYKEKCFYCGQGSKK